MAEALIFTESLLFPNVTCSALKSTGLRFIKNEEKKLKLKV